MRKQPRAAARPIATDPGRDLRHVRHVQVQTHTDGVYNRRGFSERGFRFSRLDELEQLVKDGSVNGLGRRSDETVIGTSLKIGVQIIRDRNFSVGLEQMQLSNWLNDNLNSFAGPGEYYSVVGSWTY